MWYIDNLFKFAAIGDLVPNKVCPQCHSPLYEKKGQWGPFWGCSNYPTCKYAYSPEKPGAKAPPISSEEAKTAVIPGKLFCPVCASKGITREVRKNHSAKTNMDFYGCTSWKPNSPGCGYVSYKHGDPLTAEQLQALLQQKNQNILQQTGTQVETTEPTTEVPVLKNPLDVFRTMPVVKKEQFQCPFGHGQLTLAKSGTFYCKKCTNIIKQNGGDGVGYQDKSDNSKYVVFDKISGDKIEIIGGETQTSVRDLDIETFDIEKLYVDNSKKDNAKDAAIYSEANASPELDAGQGSIVQGSLKIMSEEERAALPIDIESVIAGVNQKQQFMEDTLIDYLDLQQYIDYGNVLQAGTVGGRLIMVSDGGVMDVEKCKKSMKSPLYKFSEVGALGLMPNPSQAAALELIEAEEARNMVLCLPTGVGKTTIAEWAIADSKRRADALGRQKTISCYVCPARALAAQVSRDFSRSDDNFVHPFMKQGWKTTLLRGIGNDINDDEQHILRQRNVAGSQEGDELLPGELEEWKKNLSKDPNQSDIIVITPEKLLVSLHQPAVNPWVARITTVIFDEGHLIGEASRGPNFETEQIQIYEKFKKIRDMLAGAARIIYMSATMQNAIELVAWQQAMSISNVDPESMSTFDAGREAKWGLVRGEWTPVDVEKEFITVNFGEDSSEAGQRVLSDLASASNQVKNKDGEIVMRPTLLFVQSYTDGYMLKDLAEAYYWQCKECGLVQHGLEGPSGGVLDPGEVHGFSCPKCGKIESMGRFHVDFHNASQNSVDQTEFVDNFNNDYQHHPVLIATSTLAAGVNTGAYRVGIFNTNRGGIDIETSQLIQEIGRAGRQKFLKEFPDAKPRVTIYTSGERYVHDQRRLYANAFLRSRLGRPHKITDSVLRAISVMGVGDAKSCGNYVASTFAYYQNQIDEADPMNVRRGLEHISNSYNWADGTDKVQWFDQGRAGESGAKPCKHLNLIDVTRLKNFDQKKMANGKIVSVDDKTVQGQSMFSCLCKTPLRDGENNIIMDPNGYPVTCEALGYIAQMSEPVSPDKFIEYIDGSVRDLLAAGLIVQDNGQYKITTLGRQIIGANMSVSDAVDIIKNMNNIGFDVNSANAWTYAIALGGLRKYNDIEEGAFLSEKQIQACTPAITALGSIPGVAEGPNVKQIQCLYWLLNGVHPKDVDPDTKEKIIPECMQRDYLSTVDDFKGIFLVGLSVLAGRAKWFAGAPEEFEAIKVKLENTSKYGAVSDDMVPIVAAKGIGTISAKLLVNIGIETLSDLIIISDEDLAGRMREYRKANKLKPADDLREARRLQRIARDALSGDQLDKEKKLKNMSEQSKLQYLYTVRLLNNKAVIDRMWERRKAMRNVSPITGVEAFDSGLPDSMAGDAGWYSKYF